MRINPSVCVCVCMCVLGGGGQILLETIILHLCHCNFIYVTMCCTMPLQNQRIAIQESLLQRKSCNQHPLLTVQTDKNMPPWPREEHFLCEGEHWLHDRKIAGGRLNAAFRKSWQSKRVITRTSDQSHGSRKAAECDWTHWYSKFCQKSTI